MSRIIGIAVAAMCVVASPAAVAQFVPPPPELENRTPAPLPPPPQPPIINGPLGQAPPPGVIKQRRLKSSGDRATRCFHQGGSNGLRGGDLDAYTRACAERAHELAAGLPGWEATIDPLVRYGPALLGFMAARIAEERDGPDAYRAERARQAAWLGERL